MNNHGKDYRWAVVGAGPAGILAIGKLLDRDVPGNQILWVDPEFHVGDLGKKWTCVPSNTKVNLFIRFLEGCNSFNFSAGKDQFELMQLDPEGTCLLGAVVKPLQWVTEQLAKQVICHQGTIEQLKNGRHGWKLKTDDHAEYHASNVILSTGAEPRQLEHGVGEVVSLEDAFDDHRFYEKILKDDVVAVFGASHSGILIVKRLVELGVKGVRNFYLSPLKYAVYLKDMILFDNTGLKGTTATWAKENLSGQLPDNVQRILSTPENVAKHLPACTKVIYATGFDSRQLSIEGVDSRRYNPHCGILAPGLFGLGIAYPEHCEDKFRIKEHRVGLWKFMDYIDRVLPLWEQYSK
jgi:hypothetical protein